VPGSFSSESKSPKIKAQSARLTESELNFLREKDRIESSKYI